MKRYTPEACSVSRRRVLLLLSCAVLAPRAVLGNNGRPGSIPWSSFLQQAEQLASAAEHGRLDDSQVAEQGLRLLQQLDTDGAGFEQAVNESYESGNRYWLWQRLVRQSHLNGGVLHIDRDRMVQLHDHPGATGILRVMQGEVEVWQFDAVSAHTGSNGETVAHLVRRSRRLLKPGDVASLTPGLGNIHALRAVSQQCSMLDFFIPPYNRSRRCWYEPATEDWFDKEQISCRRIPQHAFTGA